MKKKIFPDILSIFLVILVSSFLPLMLYFSNIGGLRFYEMAIFMGFFSVLSLILFAILRCKTKSPYRSAVITSVVALIFQNIGRLQAIMNCWLVILVFVILMVIIAFLSKKLLTEDIADTFAPVLAFVMAGLLVFNSVTSMGKIIDNLNTDSVAAEDANTQYEYLMSFKDESATPDELPNVYFIMVDEYAGFDSINKLYGYDNSEFRNFLINHNFVISDSSTNFLEGTLECMANVMNMEYSENNKYSNTSETYCKEKIANSAIIRFAEENGYEVRAMQTLDLINYPSLTEQYGKIWNTTDSGKLSVELVLETSLCYPLKDAFVSVMNLFTDDAGVGKEMIGNLAEGTVAPLKFFSEEENIKGNTFNFCYAVTPHQPFYYDENGNLIQDVNHLNDWNDKKYYLGQYKYCTKLLTEAIDNIIENDPDCVIILMSDHGVRQHEPEEITWMQNMNVKDNTNILCAIYNGSKAFPDIEGLCGSNVLITVVNEVYGYNIPLIEQSDDMYFRAP